MATQIINVLCEGPHDVAFLVKILKTVGYKSNEATKIGDFPYPINSVLQTEVKKTNVEGLNLQEVRQVLLPSSTLKKGENYLFLYAMGGDGKKVGRQEILRELNSFIAEPGEISRLPEDTSLSLLYFYDADERGIEQRLSEINREIREALSVEGDIFTTNSEIQTVNQIKLGNYIFTSPSSDTGKLEDILIPLMSDGGNEAIFEAATQFLSVHFDDARLFPFKLKEENGVLVEERTNKPKHKLKYDQNKSLIGVTGQLQKSGGANTVCIGQTDFLTLEKIKDDVKCQEILVFFNQFI